MRWQDDYRSKLQTAEQAVEAIRSGDRLYVAGNAATPIALLTALAQRAGELTGVEITHMLMLGDNPLASPECEGAFRHNCLFVGKGDRQAVREGRADYVPIHLHQIPRLFDDRIVPLDAALIMASPPDNQGLMSFGVESLITNSAIRSARRVIAQVNPQMPRALGDCFVSVSDVDAIVEAEQSLPELPRVEVTDVERRIGEHARRLIPNGATLQMGIGGVPDALFEALEDARDLGIHTEMLSDGAMRAIQKGNVNGRMKSLHPGKAVITFALGSAELYAFLHDNAGIESRPVDYVNDPGVISQNASMISVNSALEIDLTGQVCADSIGTEIYSGVGGQVDFVRGATASQGGRAIIALPSTAKGGRFSRIVPFLRQGAGVVTTRADVDCAVTEHGTARLFGMNLRQRAKALIAIADPAFQDELEQAARERRLI